MRTKQLLLLVVFAPLTAACTDDSVHVRPHSNADLAGRPVTTQVDDGGMIIGAADDLAVDRDAFFVQDPPPKYCALDGGMFTPPTPPGGTLQCPDDKNLEGCPCTTLGATAPCWPGARANRNLGICMDGTTTCVQAGETVTAWGACQGAVLPVAGTTGADACQCFSAGVWNIANISPCFITDSMTHKAIGAESTNPPATAGGQPTCANDFKPAAVWSTDTVTADCAGHFTLCYTLKSGDLNAKKTTDCQIAKVCTTGDYYQPGVAQTFPPLPSWTSMDATCVQKFLDSGGYAELSVQGTSITCDTLSNYVFATMGFCPDVCNQPNPTDPRCAMCSTSGGGCFGPNCP